MIRLKNRTFIFHPLFELRLILCRYHFSGRGWITSQNQMKKCSVVECDRKVVARGFCCAHYQRWAKLGHPNVDRPVNVCSGKYNSRWKGGYIFGDGRVLVFCPDHPYPNVHKHHVFRYRLVMEKAIGRYLLPTELVHHKNGDVTDDRIENLEIHSHATHAQLHDKERGRNAKGQFNARKITV